MTRQNANVFVSGTAALEMRNAERRQEHIQILQFPGQRLSRPRHSSEPLRRFTETTFRTRVLNASEMYCSLRYEDMGGCPYHIFSGRQIAVLSACSSVIAALALALGA